MINSLQFHILVQYVHTCTRTTTQRTTRRAAFSSKIVPVEGVSLRLNIWDTAGQERVCVSLLPLATCVYCTSRAPPIGPYFTSIVFKSNRLVSILIEVFYMLWLCSVRQFIFENCSLEHCSLSEVYVLLFSGTRFNCLFMCIVQVAGCHVLPWSGRSHCRIRSHQTRMLLIASSSKYSS